ncbi:cell wall shape-determining protein, partial [Salmonella enterica subsp. enterica serovar Heidelberg str. N4630]
RHTDFIFAVLAEELGLVGILILLALYILLIMRGLWIAARAQTTFGRVMAGGLMLILFVYVFVNIGIPGQNGYQFSLQRPEQLRVPYLKCSTGEEMTGHDTESGFSLPTIC